MGGQHEKSCIACAQESKPKRRWQYVEGTFQVWCTERGRTNTLPGPLQGKLRRRGSKAKGNVKAVVSLWALAYHCCSGGADCGACRTRSAAAAYRELEMRKERAQRLLGVLQEMELQRALTVSSLLYLSLEVLCAAS